MKTLRTLSLLFAFTAFPLPAQTPPLPAAEEVLRQSIDYHDPERSWFQDQHRLVLRQTRPGKPDRAVSFTLFPSADRFSLSIREGELAVSGNLDGDRCRSEPEVIPAQAREKFGEMDCKSLRFWRDYYGYLFNAPMNLVDEGTRLEPAAVRDTFEGQEAVRLRVHYGEDQPVWDYYLEPRTFRVLGCRFLKPGEPARGETIVYEGEVVKGRVRLPKKRSWYEIPTRELVGEDIIEKFEKTHE